MSKLNTLNVPSFYFSGNAAELKFIKQGILQVVGGYTYALLSFDVTNAPDDGEILELNFGDGTVLTFEFKDTAGFDSENPLHIPDTLPIDFAITAERIAAHIYRHPYIRENYTVKFISYDSVLTGIATVEIKATKRGTDYNITLGAGSTVYLDSSYTVFHNYAANDAPLSNYKLKAAVNIVKDFFYNPSYSRVINLEATGIVDADNDQMEITFHELPEIARTALGVDIPYNPLEVQLSRHANVLLSIEVNEEYGAVGKKSLMSALGDIGTDTEYTGISAGIPLSKGNYASAFYEWGKMGTFGQKKFLTYQPRTKLVTLEQMELLTINVNSVGNANIWVTVYNEDQTTATGSISFASVGAIYIIPTGPVQLGIIDSGPVRIVKYEVYIEEPDGMQSEKFTYVIDRRYYETQRYFIFQNSLGAIDTLRCYGVNTFTLKRKSDTATNTINSNSTMDKGSIQMVYNQMEQNYTMRTGWLLTQAEKDYLQEMLYSKYVAEMLGPIIPQDPSSGWYYRQNYRACIVLVDSIEMWEDSDGMWAMEWKMKLAHDEISYSNGVAPLQYWYDTEFEFTILVNTNNAAHIGLFFSSPHYQIWVDGQAATNTITVNANSLGRLIHVKVKGYSLYDLNIEMLDGDIAGLLTFKKIETARLMYLNIIGFNIGGNYLYERVATLYTLYSIVITTLSSGAAGMDISRMFARLSEAYNKYGRLHEVDFSASTATGAAPIIKDCLINEGLIVNTL